jgi:prevent-host-death family protein
MKSVWQVQEAKNKFSQVLDQAVKEPQLITRHGRKAGVVMSYEDYRRRVSPGGRSIRGLYAKAPKFADGELDLTRDRDTGRDVTL